MTTSDPGASQCSALRAISRLRKPLTGASLSLRGRPSGRSRPPPRRASCRLRPAPLAAGAPAAEIGVVHLHPAREPLLAFAARHHRHDLVLHGPGRRLLDSSRRPSSTDETPFFAVMIRWMAANQSLSGSLVAWKIVPAVGDVCLLQRLHW